jgi:hypothetical protein
VETILRLAAFGDVRFAIGDLPGAELGFMEANTIVHELGHMLGFDHDDAGRFAVMAEDLDPGVRYKINAGKALAKPVTAVAGTSSMPAFDLLMSEAASKDAGFDSLGRALLGKGKTDR